MSDRETFFYEHAGWSYDPKHETSEEGRRRCAKELAKAEAELMKDPDVFAEWLTDDNPLRDGVEHDGPLYWCALYSGDEPQVVASLGSIDLGEHGNPASHPYAQVIAAELYLEFQAARESVITRGEN